MKFIFSILTVGFMLMSGMSFSAEAPHAKVPHDVRIAILQNVSSAAIAVQGSYSVLDAVTGKSLYAGRDLNKTVLKSEGKAIVIEDMVFNTNHIRIVPRAEVIVWLGSNTKRSYRGIMDVYLQSDKTILLVNELDIENYIKGVLQHEISDKWPMEAIKAQAVAVRSYAYYQMFKNEKKPFDMTGDIYSQVYGGSSAERYRTNLATDQTAGMVLGYQGLIFPTYFHSTCGGHTADVRQLWANEDWPPMRGRECRFCNISPHYRWKRNYRSKDIQDKLNAKGYKLGLIKEIRVLEHTPSGRVKTLEIETRDGQKTEVTAKIFRDIIGPNQIKSNFFEIEMKGYYFDLTGHGWGHGVGLCQWGTLGMAREGYKFEDILKYYYPGSELKKIDQVKFKMPQKSAVSDKP